MAKLARRVSGEKSARSAISRVCRRERRRSAQNLVGRKDGIGVVDKTGSPCSTVGVRGHASVTGCSMRAGTGAVSPVSPHGTTACHAEPGEPDGTQRAIITHPRVMSHITCGYTISYAGLSQNRRSTTTPTIAKSQYESCMATWSHTYTQNLTPSVTLGHPGDTQRVRVPQALTPSQSLTHSM